MNRKLTLVLMIILTLFLFELISRKGTIIPLTMPFLVYLCVGVFTSPRKIQLKVSRKLNAHRSDADEIVNMSLTVENHSTTIPRLQFKEPWNPRLILVEGELEKGFFVPAKEMINLTYTFRAPHGRYSWNSIKLVASDPFGLFEKQMEFPDETHLLVWQDYHQLKRFRYKPQPTIQTAGPYLSRQPGSGTDFWGVREYRMGDSLRSIHWRLAARHPRIFYSKVQESEEMADIGILVDARSSAYQTNGTDDLFEHSIQAAGTFAKYFLSAGNRVSMLILNDQLIRIFPGYGNHQLIQIYDHLAGCTLGEKVTLQSLKYLPAKLFPSQSVIVMISPLLPNDLDFIRRMQAKKYQILLICPNSLNVESLKTGTNVYHSYAIRAARLERDVLFQQLQKKGTQIIDWEVNQPLINALQAVRFRKM